MVIFFLNRKDDNRPQRRSPRENTGRKPRGQHSRKGDTLKMVPMTDIIKNMFQIIAAVVGGIFQKLQLSLQERDKLLTFPR
ncbi:MAG TPA: hypothetical protein VLZ33_07845 [Dysgonamonadaceae bacterium]|nr:hypothetical protein [Dysgonamonadaceae bacterium]